MNAPILKYFYLLLFIFLLGQMKAQTIIMNEVSNGPSGNQEYVEFVVVSTIVSYNCTGSAPPCVDLRGWIFDDNSGYHGSAGIASGAVRFSQNILWSCVPLGTIIVIYNNGDRNPAIPADDLSMTDGNCRIIAPISSPLFESNGTTPGASACSYPATGWTSGGSWNNTLLANAGDCARIVNLAGCEVFSVCWGTDNLNNMIYFSGAGGQKVWYFNGTDATIQANWSVGSAASTPGLQTPGAPNNAANASYISQFNNNCTPITLLNVTATSVNAGCTCNGSATATASGSIGGYTYVWYDAAFNPIGQTTATATGLCGGTYNVIGTSHIGCTDTATVTITSASSTTVAVNSQSVCTGSPATLTATPTAAGGTYLWSPGGQTTQSISVSPSSTTTYSVTYTFSGCSTGATGVVTVNPVPVITVNSPVICNGITTTLTAAGGTTYTWSAGATPTGIDNASVSPATTTTYTVTGTSSGCSSTAVSTVTVNPAPFVIVNSPTVCAGTSAALTASGATSYTWSTGATATGVNTATASPATATTYTVTGTTSGCSSTAIATVTESAPVAANGGLNDSICSGASSTLNASPNGTGYSFLWSPAAGLSNAAIYNPVATPSSTTTYTVTITDAGGCTGIDSVTVFVNTPLSVTVSGLPASCNGAANAQVSVTPNGGTAPYTYSWSSSCTTATCAVSAGTYTVTVTDAWASGCVATGSVTVTEPAALVLTLSSPAQLTCAGDCDGSVMASATGGTGAYTYSWNTSPVQNTATATGLCAGTYICTITDANTCSTTATATIIQPTAVTIAPISNVAVCNGTASFTANVSGGTGTYTYSWNPASGLSSATVSNPGVTASATTTYTLTTWDGNGCLAQTTATANVNPALTVTATGPAAGCAGQPATLSATAANGSGSGYSYSWTPAVDLNNPNIQNPQASPGNTITYTVTVTDNCLTSATATATVTILPTPHPVFSSTAVSGCVPLCVTFSDLSTISGGTITGYGWNFNEGTAVGTNPTHCFNTPGTYPVTLTDTSSAGCIATSATPYVITVYPDPVAEFTYPPASMATPVVEFTDQSYITGGIINSWNWNFDDALAGADSISAVQHPDHAFSEAGEYCATLIVQSNGGCSDTMTHCFVVEGEFTFYVPNAFSPDNNGLNDVFLPRGQGWKPGSYLFEIYDRWGNLCFSTTDVTKGWNGKIKKGSELAQIDVYIWKVQVRDTFGTPHSYMGDVSVVK